MMQIFSLIFFFTCLQIVFCVFFLKSKIKKGVFAVALIVYVYGFFATNDSENWMRILWVLSPVVLALFISKKDFKGINKDSKAGQAKKGK